jgi:alpha-N-arabinofuranosidase
MTPLRVAVWKQVFCPAPQWFFSALNLIALEASVAAAIVVDATSPGVPAGRFLGGSAIVWQVQGNGLLDISQPVRVFRPEALSRTSALGLSLLRFGDGSFEQYYWRDGVGPSRPGRIRPGAHWPSKNEVGIIEAWQFARSVGAELVMVVPLRETLDRDALDAPDGAQLAANLVEFCNGRSPGLTYGEQQGWRPSTYVGEDVRPGGSPLSGKKEFKVEGSYLAGEKAPDGYFAWLREYFGHPEPLNIRFWEVGNETYWAYFDGKPWASPAKYRELFVKFVDAMKQKDPSILVGAQGLTHHILASGTPERYREGWIWSEGVFGKPPDYSEAYQKADFIILHEYVGPQAASEDSEAEYRALFDDVVAMEERFRAYQSRYPKPIFITEYNVQYGVFVGSDPQYRKHQHRLKSALAVARMQNAFLRTGITAACYFHLLEIASGPGGWTGYPTFRLIYDDIDRDTGVRRKGVTVPYYALQLYNARTPGRYILPVSVSDAEYLDVVALRSPAKTLSLMVVNFSSNRDITAQVTLNGFSPAAQASVSTLNSPDGMEGCVYVDPSRAGITTRDIVIEGSTFTYTFPAHSLTVIDLEPQAPAPPNSELPPPPDPEPEPHNPNPAGIEVQVTANNPSPLPGDTVTFTSVCRNLGNTTVEQTSVTFLVPDGMEIITGSITPAGVYSPITRKVEWTVTGLKPGQSRQLKCSAKVR